MIRALWIDENGVDANYTFPYSSIDEFFMMEGSRANTYFMASTKTQFSYIFDYCERKGLRPNIKASNGTDIFSFNVGQLNFRSVDFIFNKPIGKLIKEYQLDYGAAGIAQLVDIIEEAGKPFSFINKEYLTISKLAILNLTAEEYAPKEYINFRYPCCAETIHKFFVDNGIYKGGINFVNENLRHIEVNNLYKYDKNSYFAYVMKYGNLPVGHRYCKKGAPPQLKDVLVHIKLTGIAKFKGIYPFKECGNGIQVFNEHDLWIWSDELAALMNYYNFYKIEYIEYYEWLWNKPDEYFGKFVDNFFKQKKEATGTRRYFVKRILNGAYGKLAQSPYRSNFKMKDGALIKSNKTYLNFSEKFSVVVASKITALARAWLLNDIYEACGGRPDLYFVYCDTDSMMLLKPIQNTGDDLGDYKDEGPAEGKPWPKAKFLGCKCYMLYDGEHYECHAAGVNREALEREINALDWPAAFDKFSYGATFNVPTIVTENNIKRVKMMPKTLKNFEDYERDDTEWNATFGVYERLDNK